MYSIALGKFSMWFTFDRSPVVYKYLIRVRQILLTENKVKYLRAPSNITNAVWFLPFTHWWNGLLLLSYRSSAWTTIFPLHCYPIREKDYKRCKIFFLSLHNREHCQKLFGLYYVYTSNIKTTDDSAHL